MWPWGATKKAFVFEAYVERFLAPSLSPGQVVVVMDNPGAHKTGRVREPIEGRGCEPWFLPAYYSPDLNPLEEASSKVKARLSKAARTREAWWKRWATLSSVAPRDAEGWFAHYGYGSPGQ